jgi:hypothetical protein
MKRLQSAPPVGAPSPGFNPAKENQLDCCGSNRNSPLIFTGPMLSLSNRKSKANPASLFPSRFRLKADLPGLANTRPHELTAGSLPKPWPVFTHNAALSEGLHVLPLRRTLLA